MISLQGMANKCLRLNLNRRIAETVKTSNDIIAGNGNQMFMIELK